MSERTYYRRKKAAGLTHPATPGNFNEAFFDTWSDEMAWLLGLIWSDGCLSGNSVEICSKDLQLVDLVMAVIEGGRYNLKNQGRHLQVRFTSKHTASRLRSLGLTERKSLTIRWPIIEEEYEGAFMRGLIDGDGSVLERQGRPGQQVPDLRVQLVTASAYLRDGVKDWLLRQALRYTIYERPSPPHHQWMPLWRFTLSEQASLRRLHSLLYPDENVVCLHRKRIPFDLWMSTPRAKTGRPKKTL